MPANFENKTSIKMIDFITSLYHKYKVLNQLSDQQSHKFQTQIVSSLVDQDQNVDPQALDKIIDQNGIEAFIVEILGKVIQRQKSKVVIESSKSNSLAVQSIKKEQIQFQKKNKFLERKQQRLRTTQEQLLSVCKNKIAMMQSQSMKRIASKQVQIKKSITNILNQFKTKQKILLQKLQQLKSNKSLMKMIEQKERTINEKMKFLQKRQKQLKNKDDTQLIIKKDSQIQELTNIHSILKQSYKELNRKYKNMELAYRKLKNDYQKLINQKCTITKQINNNTQKVQKKIEFDNLQISYIQTQTQQKPISSQIIHKLQSIPYLLSIDRQKNQVIAIISQILNTQPSLFDNIRHNSEQSEQSLQFLRMEGFNEDPHQHLINQIKSFDLQNQKQRDLFFANKRLQKWLQKASQLRYPMNVSNQLLQMMLPLFQNNKQTDKLIYCLCNEQIINHIQKIYLCHQTNEQIAQTTTLILSRIKLWKQSIDLIDSFRKAIQLRKKLQPQSSLLYLNIKHLL